MPTIYCPTNACGAAVQYAASKPETCPKCGKAFASAFKTVTAAPTLAPVAPKVAAVKATRPSSAFVKGNHVASPYPTSTIAHDAGYEAPDDDLLVEGGEDATKDEIAARASEIQASIDPSTIVRLVEGETKSFGFGDWCAQPRQ